MIDVGGHVTLYFSRIMQMFLLFHFCQKPQNQFQHPCFLFHSLLLLLFSCLCVPYWPLNMVAWFCCAVFFVRAIAMDVRWYFTFAFYFKLITTCCLYKDKAMWRAKDLFLTKPHRLMFSPFQSPLACHTTITSKEPPLVGKKNVV